jgi:hypothetical protein
LCLFLYNVVIGQDVFEKVDKFASQEFREIKDLPRLSSKLTKDYTTDEEKARAIFIWITSNINYDIQQLLSKQPVETTDLIANRALKNRKGVCMHYAMLFDTLAKAANLKTHYITGYARESNGELARSAHAWIGINIDNQYYVIDPTWASGYVLENRYIKQLENKYFLMSPSLAIKSHMPYDPMFQFLSHPITHRQFLQQDYLSIDSTVVYNFDYILDLHLKKNRLDQLISSLERVEKIAFAHPQIDYHISYLKDDICYEKYNLAQEQANLAIDHINQIITSYNNRANGIKPDLEKIKSSLSQAHDHLEAADNLLSTIVSNNPTIIDLTIKQRDQIGNLRNNLNEKQRYYETGMK